jgi:hypothetical protein
MSPKYQFRTILVLKMRWSSSLLFLSTLPSTLSMFPDKPSETGVDVVTCKMNKNSDKKDDVSSSTNFFPPDPHPTPPPIHIIGVLTCSHPPLPPHQCNTSCICQKLVWTLEFNPMLRTNTKTTKICEIWMDNGLADKTCAYTCASIANSIYASQGTDPDVCPQIEREHAQITGGNKDKLKYTKFMLLEQNERQGKTTSLRARTVPHQPSTWKMPSFAPPQEYSKAMVPPQ